MAIRIFAVRGCAESFWATRTSRVFPPRMVTTTHSVDGWTAKMQLTLAFVAPLSTVTARVYGVMTRVVLRVKSPQALRCCCSSWGDANSGVFSSVGSSFGVPFAEPWSAPLSFHGGAVCFSWISASVEPDAALTPWEARAGAAGNSTACILGFEAAGFLNGLRGAALSAESGTARAVAGIGGGGTAGGSGGGRLSCANAGSA